MRNRTRLIYIAMFWERIVHFLSQMVVLLSVQPQQTPPKKNKSVKANPIVRETFNPRVSGASFRVHNVVSGNRNAPRKTHNRSYRAVPTSGTPPGSQPGPWRIVDALRAGTEKPRRASGTMRTASRFDLPDRPSAGFGLLAGMERASLPVREGMDGPPVDFLATVHPRGRHYPHLPVVRDGRRAWKRAPWRCGAASRNPVRYGTLPARTRYGRPWMRYGADGRCGETATAGTLRPSHGDGRTDGEASASR